MRMTLCAVAVVFTTSFSAAQEKAAVREIEADGIFDLAKSTPTWKVTEPKVFSSAADVAQNRAFTKGAAAALKKQVDFEKEKVVLFFWDWAGGDKIVPDTDTHGTFAYSSTGKGKGGIGTKIFVVPKDAKVKVTQGK
jgi:hypothetical protein